MAREGERPSFRSVANAIRTGISIDKIYRGMSHGTQMEIPADIKDKLKVGYCTQQHQGAIDTQVVGNLVIFFCTG